MGKKFVVTRVGNVRMRVCYKDHRAELLGPDDRQLSIALHALGLNRNDAKLLQELRETMDLFLLREQRSLEKFGKPRMFRIWRVDPKMLQVDFDGGYAELKKATASDAVLKQCLAELGANQLLLPDLKKDLRDFQKEDEAG